MKIRNLIIFSIISIMLLSSCGVSSNETTSDATSGMLNDVDYSRVVVSLPGNDDEKYETPESLLGVSENPKKIVGRMKKSSLKEKYETLAKDIYVVYHFEHEDLTASQMYIYYFYETEEAYKEAYDAFSLSKGSPSIKNEQSLFFGNGGSAEFYVSGRPSYSDISISFQAQGVEIINSWGEEQPTDSSDTTSLESVDSSELIVSSDDASISDIVGDGDAVELPGVDFE